MKKLLLSVVLFSLPVVASAHSRNVWNYQPNIFKDCILSATLPYRLNDYSTQQRSFGRLRVLTNRVCNSLQFVYDPQPSNVKAFNGGVFSTTAHSPYRVR